MLLRLDLKSLVFALVAALCASVASAQDLVVGQTLALTGVLAPAGNGVRNGAKIYFDALNARGGVHGRKIVHVAKDDGYKVDQTVKNVRDLLAENQPIALLGCNGTANVEALIKEQVLDEAGIAMLGPRTGASSIRQHPLVFHVRASYHDEVERMIDQYVGTGFKRIGVVYQDDAFGKDGLSGVEATLRKHGLVPAAAATYERNTANVEPAVATMLEAKPQAVVLVMFTAPAAAFVKQYRAAAGAAQLLGLSIIDGPDLAKRVGPDVARGVVIAQVMPNPRKHALKLVAEFRRDYREFGPKDVEPNGVALEGYLMAKTLSEALHRAGKNPSRAGVVRALEAMESYDAGGYYVSFSKTNRRGSNNVNLSILDGAGRVVQ